MRTPEKTKKTAVLLLLRKEEKRRGANLVVPLLFGMSIPSQAQHDALSPVTVGIRPRLLIPAFRAFGRLLGGERIPFHLPPFTMDYSRRLSVRICVILFPVNAFRVMESENYYSTGLMICQ